MSAGMNVLYSLGRPLPAGSMSSPTSSGWSQIRRVTDLHRGLDLPAKTGTPIRAMAAGVVSRYVPSDTGDAGIWLGITHPGGIVTRYMHMSKIRPLPVGTRVAKGELLGLVGATGDAAIQHLHTDLSVPLAMLPEVARVVGQPKSGWGGAGGAYQAPYGYKIPSEPWVPVDGYSSRTLADAIKQGIPLYKPGRGGVIAAATGNPLLLGAALAGAAIYLLR
jgi:murein DD-endopeptidase MepM/ murein hydrolase activator NlpD